MVYHRTKEQRREWWNSLSPEEQSLYIHKWERKRVKDYVPIVLNAKPLTKKEMRGINATMRRIGLERFIVLPD